MPDDDFALPPASAVQAPATPTQPAPAPKKSQTALIVMVVVAVGLGALLFGLNLTQQHPDQADAPVDESVALLKAELETQRASLNARRAELGMPPLAQTTSNGESSQEIANRLTRDSASLVAILDSLQKIIAEKEKTIQEKNAALLASEQANRSLSESASRLQAAPAASNQSHVAEMMQRKIDMLEKELADTKAALSQAGKTSPDEDLQRQLDESQRARAFFESRAKELEQKAPPVEKAGDLPPPPDGP